MQRAGAKPAETYKTLLKEEQTLSNGTTVRDVEQIYNVRRESNRIDHGDTGNQIFADHIMHLRFLIAEGDNFVQSLIHESSKVPSVLLFTQDTMNLVRVLL